MPNREPELDEFANVVDFIVSVDEIDFEIANLQCPDEVEAIRGYSIDDEPDDAA